MPTTETDAPAGSDQEWVFLALFKCERCGRDVTVRKCESDPREARAYRNLRVCPDGCAS